MTTLLFVIIYVIRSTKPLTEFSHKTAGMARRKCVITVDGAEHLQYRSEKRVT